MIIKAHIITTIRIGFLIIALCVVGLGVLTYVHTEQANSVQSEIAYTDQVIEHTNEALVNLHAYIGAVRGYLISPHPMYTERIESTSQQYQTHMDTLKSLTIQNSMHQQRLKHVEDTFSVIATDLVKPLITSSSGNSLSPSSVVDAQQFQISSSISRVYLDEMTKLLLAISNDERAERNQMVAKTVTNLNFGWAVNIFGTMVILFLILGIQRITIHQIRKAEIYQKQADTELRISHDKLSHLIEATRVGTWQWDIPTGILEINERWASMLGYQKEELEPISIQTWRELTHPDDLQVLEQLLEDVFAHRLPYFDGECRMRHKKGSWVWIHDRGQVVLWDDNNQPLIMSGTHDDISQLKETQQYLSLETRRLEATLLSVGDGVITTDASGCILMLNSVAESLTGWTRDEALGKVFSEVFVTKDALTGDIGDNPVARVLESQKTVELDDDTILISRDGSERFIEDSAAPIIDDSGTVAGVILVFRNVTEKRKERERIVEFSLTDQLTKAHNRRSYDRMLNRFEKESRYPIAFVIADVNGLKLTNDAFGHDMGDQLLVSVATILKDNCLDGDIVARLGGDEFIVLMPNTNESQATIRIQAMQEQLQQEKVGPLPISISFGLALKHDATMESGMVFRQAESRMYTKKITESPLMKRRLIDLLLNWQHEMYEQERDHSNHVEHMSIQFAQYLGLDEETIRLVGKAARYHDIGKVAIDKRLLLKNRALDEYEWNDMRRHAEIGYNILRTIPELYAIAEGILHHHERWDGSGYPRGIAREEIPLTSRIISICDTFDAIVGNRSYSNKRTKEEALGEIAACSGTQFDPTLVSEFLNMMAD